MPGSRTDIVHAELTAKSRALRLVELLVKYRSPSSHCAPIPAACGVPSGRQVPRKYVTSGVGGPAMAARALVQSSSSEP
jgi:hypothetical protein